MCVLCAEKMIASLPHIADATLDQKDNDLMNYEQKSTSSDQRHKYQEKTRLVLIIGSRNKT
jgi:hypothetical protein